MAGQHWNPETCRRDAGFVARLGEPLLDLLAPRAHERILDLGCGDGALTAKLLGACAQVVGIDASAEQVAAARARGIDAHTRDAETLGFEGEFDAVLSNAALHWMKRPDAVIAGVWRALVPGGRFVAELGGAGNVQAIRTALVAGLTRRGIDGEARVPWYFPSEGEYRARLEAGGFSVESSTLFPRPTLLPGDVLAWLRMFGHSFLHALPPAEHDAYLSEVRGELAPKLKNEDGSWTADYVRLRVVARKR